MGRSGLPFKLVHAHANQELFEEEEGGKLVILGAVIYCAGDSRGMSQVGNVVGRRGQHDQPIHSIKDLNAALAKPINGIHKIEFDSFPQGDLPRREGGRRDQRAVWSSARHHLFGTARLTDAAWTGRSGVIFDWDGVIIDSHDQHRQAFDQVAAELGKPFSDELFAKCFGMRNRSILGPLLGWVDPAATPNGSRTWLITRSNSTGTSSSKPGSIRFPASWSYWKN